MSGVTQKADAPALSGMAAEKILVITKATKKILNLFIINKMELLDKQSQSRSHQLVAADLP